MYARYWKHCAPSKRRPRRDGSSGRLDRPHRNERRRAGWAPPLARTLVAFCLVAMSATAYAQSGPPITRIEEDWVVEIGEPAAEEEAPQITTVISPNSGLDGVYAVFELNHSTLPDYSAGGMQLQLWDGENDLDHKSPTANALLSTIGEQVCYTSVMSLRNGSLRFSIRNGTSTTWGTFGSNGQLLTSVASNLTSLSDYNPAVSVRNSKVGFAANRVTKLALKQVRYYSNGTLVTTDSTERVASTPGATSGN